MSTIGQLVHTPAYPLSHAEPLPQAASMPRNEPAMLPDHPMDATRLPSKPAAQRPLMEPQLEATRLPSSPLAQRPLMDEQTSLTRMRIE